MKRFLTVILSLSLVVSPIQANVCSATDVVAVQRNVTELINKLPEKLRVPVHKLLNGDPTWNATGLSLNETETRMLNEVLVEMHLLKHSESLDGEVIHVKDGIGKRFLTKRNIDTVVQLGMLFLIVYTIVGTTILNRNDHTLWKSLTELWDEVEELRANIAADVDELATLVHASLAFGVASTMTDEQRKQELWKKGADFAAAFFRKHDARAEASGVAQEA